MLSSPVLLVSRAKFVIASSMSCSDQVPARPGAPGGLGDRAGERVDAPGHLGVGHELRLVEREIAGEGGGELLPVAEQGAVLRRQDRWQPGRQAAGGR
jgi:hypothetical protein